MAKQQGSHPLTGIVDGFSYYYNKEHGFLMRRKGGPTKEQIKRDSAFNIPRRNNEEFGRASKYGKLIRYGFSILTRNCKDATMYSRLSTRIREIMKMDKESELGKRDLRNDNLSVLRHFEWDARSLSKQYFELPVEMNVSKECLEVTTGISLDKKPRGADAWKLYSIAVTIDFRNEALKRDVQESEVYEFEKGDFAESFTHYFAEAGTLFHGMCFAWYTYDATIDDYRLLKQEHINAGFIRFVR